jgi:hypothetical protein
MARHLIAATAIAALLASPAFAAPPAAPVWAQAEKYEIRVDEHRCFFTTVTQVSKTVVRLGFIEAGELYFALANAGWQSLRDGATYPVSVTFDNKPPYTAEAFGVQLPGTSTVFLTLRVGADFTADFMLSKQMNVSYRGQSLLRANLGGTYAAGQELLRCQEAMNETRPASADPFKSNDPFVTH